MNYYDRSASATRMIDEGLRDLTEEDRLEVEAESEERRGRHRVINGYYPGSPTKRMSLSLHRDQLEAIEATADEWKVFQERHDLANGFDPVTGERLTREQHVEAIRQLELTPEDLREINYWASAERDMLQEYVAEDSDAAWKVLRAAQ